MIRCYSNKTYWRTHKNNTVVYTVSIWQFNNGKYKLSMKFIYMDGSQRIFSIVFFWNR
jgi:hypothetical protein